MCFVALNALVLLAALAFAPATQITSVTTLPATCNPGGGDGGAPMDEVSRWNGTANQPYYCGPGANTWTAFGAGVGGGTQTIANGTATLGTAAIGAASCASTVTVAATGVSASDNVLADFSVDPTSTVGYQPGNMLTIVKFATSGNVNFKVCNNTGSSITPGSALTVDWRVVR